jgi:hypothetical protein
MEVLDRLQLMQQVTLWQEERIDSEAMWLWALQTRSQVQASDAAVRDALDMLCAIPEDLLICEDAEVILDALGNPLDQTDLSCNLLWNYIDMIDTKERRTSLSQDPFYGAYCLE